MQVTRAVLLPLVALCLLSPALRGQHRNRQENPALLGVVTAPAKKGLDVLFVLPDSPAAEIGMKAGDVLLKIGQARLESPLDVEDELAKVEPGSSLEVTFLQDRKSHTETATVVARDAYKGEFLRRPQARVGFPAPAWYAFAWGNVKKPSDAPTLKGCAGQVVVIHCFQGW